MPRTTKLRLTGEYGDGGYVDMWRCHKADIYDTEIVHRWISGEMALAQNGVDMKENRGPRTTDPTPLSLLSVSLHPLHRRHR